MGKGCLVESARHVALRFQAALASGLILTLVLAGPAYVAAHELGQERPPAAAATIDQGGATHDGSGPIVAEWDSGSEGASSSVLLAEGDSGSDAPIIGGCHPLGHFLVCL